MKLSCARCLSLVLLGASSVAGQTFTEFRAESPFSIAAGPDGNLWFTQWRFGNSIGRVTLDGEITIFPIPTPSAEATGIVAGPDGALWFHERQKIGRITTDGVISEFSPPPGYSYPPRFTAFGPDWRKLDGTTGQGQAVPLTSDSGYFWFFNAANIEAVVKVLNACAANGRFWVFAAGLTNVEVTLRVADTQTGSLKTYVNPLGTAYGPIQDTSAFETCP